MKWKVRKAAMIRTYIFFFVILLGFNFFLCSMQIDIVCDSKDPKCKGVKIRVDGWKRREKDESSSDFLSRVYKILNQINEQQGNNPLSLSLPTNNLADDISAFSSFIEQCATSPIVNQLTSLDIGLNGFTELPENLRRFKNLKCLYIEANPLKFSAVELICIMTWLEKVDFSCCELTELSQSFANLKKVRWCNLGYNFLKKESLKILAHLKELEELNLSSNNMTLWDVLNAVSQWPKIRKIYASRIESGKEVESYLPYLPPNLNIPPGVEIYC